MESLATWHHRGGMAGYGQPPQVVMTIDPETGEQFPVVVGTDQNGYPVVLDANSAAPWQAGLISQAINTAGGIFGGGNRYGLQPYGNPYGGATLTTAATPAGIGAGLNLSNNTLLLIGAAVLLFIFAKGRR